MRTYVCGPMSGLPELNFPAFHAEAARLRAAGHDVVNPAEINSDPTASWKDCMRADIRELVTCDAIQLLPGWECSKGAQLEYLIAARLGLLVLAPAAVVTPANTDEALSYGFLEAWVAKRNTLALAETTGTH